MAASLRVGSSQDTQGKGSITLEDMAGQEAQGVSFVTLYGRIVYELARNPRIAQETLARRLDVTMRTVQRHLDEPELPDVDLFLRSGGEQRTSNFLLWQSAYAELVFVDDLWPDVDRRVLWRAVEEYARRDRRYGGAIDAARP